jgi:DNA-binding NarL/FixJ family response regulator
MSRFQSASECANKARLLVADDHGLFLDGLKEILEPEYAIVGVAKNGYDLVKLAEQLQPDAIISDISMPSLNGIDAARQIRKVSSRVKLIFLTMHVTPDYVIDAFRAGANGYVLKQANREELTTAIQQVLRGHAYVSPQVTQDAMGALLAVRDGGSEPGQLTMRQREVIQLTAEGYTAKEIASMLNVSPKTVDFHKNRIMHQLGVHSSAELIRYAIKNGYIEA